MTVPRRTPVSLPRGAHCRDCPRLRLWTPPTPTTAPTARPCWTKLAELGRRARRRPRGRRRQVRRAGTAPRGKLLARERDRAAARPRTRPFLELSPLAGLGQRLHRRRLAGHRHRRGRGRRVPDHRQRPDRARRRQQPVDAEEGPAGQRDRPRQPAAAASTWSSPAAPTCPPRRRSSSPAARCSATSPGCRRPASRTDRGGLRQLDRRAARTSPACPTTSSWSRSGRRSSSAGRRW